MIDPSSNGGKGFDTTRRSGPCRFLHRISFIYLLSAASLAERYLVTARAVILGEDFSWRKLVISACRHPWRHNHVHCVNADHFIGTGFFKPNIGTILGNIYNREDTQWLKTWPTRSLRLVNIGAFICNTVAAYLRNRLAGPRLAAASGG